MSANAIVVYTLSAAGNLGTASAGLSKGLDDLRKKAVAATAATTEMAAKTVAASRAGINSIGEQAKVASEGTFKALAGIALLGYGIDKILSKNKEWTASTGRLKKTFNDLGESIAASVGPSASKFVDAFNIGFVYLKSILLDGIVPALSLVQDTFSKMTGLAKTGFEIWKSIFSGDFDGAASLIERQQSSFVDLLKSTETKAREISFASEKARQAALSKYIEIRLAQKTDDVKVSKTSSSASTSEWGASDSAAAMHASIGQASESARETAARDDEQAAKDLADWHTRAEMMHASIGSLGDATTDATTKFQRFTATIGKAVAASSSYTSINTPIDAIGQAGPYGALIAALVNLVKDLPETMLTGFQDFYNIIGDVGSNLEQVMGPITEQIVNSIPQVVAKVATLVPEIMIATISSIPSTIEAVINAAVQILPALVAAFGNLVSETLGKFGNVGADENGQGGHFIFQTNLGKKDAEVHRFLGVHVGNPFGRTKLADGGEVTRTGLAVVHRGETFSGVNDRAVNTTNNSRSIQANFYAADPRRIAESLRYLSGDYGIGLTTEPFGGV